MAAERNTVILAGGGTGGHVYPGIALARELERQRPGIQIQWVGTEDRVEARAVPRAGYPIEFLDVAFLKGRSGAALVKAASRLPGAGVRAMGLVRRYNPLAVVGLGGFVSGPVCAAAATMGRPVFLLEQNARPGMTNRYVAKVAKRIYATFEESAEHFPTKKLVVAGNPVRRDLLDAVTDSVRAPGPPRVLAFGGSQGALTINEGVPRVVQELVEQGVELEVKHASGRGAAESTRERYDAIGFPAEVLDYIDDMAAAYSWADLVLCRAGATTIAELTALGKPALFVPFPHAADDHQTANALAVVKAGGGVMVNDRDFRETDKATRLLGPLLRNPEVLERMGTAARGLGRPEAASTIATDILGIVG